MSLENKNIDGEGINASQKKENTFANLKYLIVGIFFGIVFVKAEIISWFRIQEMKMYSLGVVPVIMWFQVFEMFLSDLMRTFAYYPLGCLVLMELLIQQLSDMEPM